MLETQTINKASGSTSRDQTRLLPSYLRSGKLLPPAFTGLPLSVAHTNTDCCHRPAARIASVTFLTVLSTHETIPMNVFRCGSV